MSKIVLRGNYGDATFRGENLLETWSKVIAFLGGRISSQSYEFNRVDFGYTWCKLPSKIEGCEDTMFRIKLGKIAKRRGFRAFEIDSCIYRFGC